MVTQTPQTRSTYPSRPPLSVLEYEFSYARSIDRFRFRHRDQFWLCDVLAGDLWIRRADGNTGKLYVVCQLSIDSAGTAQVWAPDGAILDALQAEVIRPGTNAQPEDWADFPQGLRAQWRLCLNRPRRVWRIRDERHPEKMWNTNGYRGIVHISRMDGGPHVHADQPAWISDNGVVQFYG